MTENGKVAITVGATWLQSIKSYLCCLETHKKFSHIVKIICLTVCIVFR
jgi:hypothetical protein